MFLTNESSSLLTPSLREMICGMTDQLVEEVSRVIEERTRERMNRAMSAVEQMERRMLELEESMDRRMASLEADMEERMRTTEDRIESRVRSLEEMVEMLDQAPASAQAEGTEAGGNVSRAQLEKRMEGMEASLQAAIGVMMPKVEELVAQLENASNAASISSTAVASQEDSTPASSSSDSLEDGLEGGEEDEASDDRA